MGLGLKHPRHRKDFGNFPGRGVGIVSEVVDGVVVMAGGLVDMMGDGGGYFRPIWKLLM